LTRAFFDRIGGVQDNTTSLGPTASPKFPEKAEFKAGTGTGRLQEQFGANET